MEKIATDVVTQCYVCLKYFMQGADGEGNMCDDCINGGGTDFDNDNGLCTEVLTGSTTCDIK